MKDTVKGKAKDLRRLINQHCHKLSLLHEIEVKEKLRKKLELLSKSGTTYEQLKKEISLFTK